MNRPLPHSHDSLDPRTDLGSIREPSLRDRLVIAVVVATASGGLALWLRLGGRSNFADFDYIWTAARALMEGRDPFIAVRSTLVWPMVYPMPAVVIGFPLALLPKEWAHAFFAALGMGLLTFSLAGRGWWALIALLGWPTLNAIELGQWSPLLTAAALSPALWWTALAKPSVGAAIVGGFALNASRRDFTRNTAIAAAVLIVCFLLWPSWVPDWLDTLKGHRHFTPLVLRPGGALILLALLRFRLPEARLLVLLSLVPQTFAPYELLPLVLVVRTRREALIFALCGIAVVPFLWSPSTAHTLSETIAHDAPLLLLAGYVPALIMVLRRPNIGPLPGPVERRMSMLPRSWRGTTA